MYELGPGKISFWEHEGDKMRLSEKKIHELRSQCSTASGREAAIKLMVSMGQEAVEGLGAALHDQDRYLRRAVVSALGQIGGPRAVELLNAALPRDRNRYVRVAIAKALGEMQDARAVDPLARALQDEDGDVRREAIMALANIRDQRALAPLLGVLRDKDPFARDSAAYVLVLFREGAVEPLLALLRDQEPHVRAAAAHALSWIRDSRSAAPLLAALEDESAAVRLQAIQALGELQEIRAVAPIIATLGNGKEWVAAKALGQIGDPRAVEPLLALLKDRQPSIEQWEFFKAVAQALGQIGDLRAVEPLMALVGGSEVLAKVLEAIQKILMRHAIAFADEHLATLALLRDDVRIIYADGAYNHDETSGISFDTKGLRQIAQQELDRRGNS